jgi:hypothetical protein
MLEQAKLVGVALAVLCTTTFGSVALLSQLAEPWPEEGSDAWTQLAIARQTPPPHVITQAR